MKLYDENNIPYEAISCRKPLMEDNHRNRTWDYIDKIIDGEEYKFFLDTTWGKCLYFYYNYRWYRVNLYQNNSDIYYMKKLSTKILGGYI